MHSSKIPVAVLTGFLGAGKTTLINQLLFQNTDRRIGVVVNEFGEEGIDGQLIDTQEDAIVELRNGCVCCTVRADLVGSILRLLDSPGPPLDYLLVETSGLADPAPVLQTFLADPDLLERVVLDSVITLVDAVNVDLHVGEEIPREQIAFADTVILNKASLIEPWAMEQVILSVKRINPLAVTFLTDHADLPSEKLLATKRFSLTNVLAIEPDLLDGGDHDHEHDDSIRSCSFVSMRPLDAKIFNRWINQLVLRDGEKLLRSKGILAIAGEARQFHFHSVHMLVDAKPARAWRSGEALESRIVFIGRGLDTRALEAGFRACEVHSSQNVDHQTLNSF